MLIRKLISGFILAIVLILPPAQVDSYVDKQIIILKDGTRFEGKVISSDDAWIKIKSEGKPHTFKRIDIKSIKKKMPREELLLPAEEAYNKLKLPKKKSDAETYYNLGLFCLERNLFDCALIEFDKAKKLDNKYAVIIDTQVRKIYEAKAEGKYDAGLYCYNKGEYKKALDIFEKVTKSYPEISLTGKFQEMIELSKEKVISIPELTKEEIEEELRNGEFLIPFTGKIANVINIYLSSLTNKNKSKAEEYCARCLGLAKEYLEKAESDESNPQRWRDYQIALYCYRIASWDRSLCEKLLTPIQKIRAKIDENFRNKLLCPSTVSELKYVEAFIEEFVSRSREEQVSRDWCRDTAEDCEAKARDEQNPSIKRKLLNKALNCYLVLANSFPEGSEHKKAGLYGWARCFEKLEKLNNVD
ncbi:MAG: hypothetical protein KAJ66_04890 [Candidatus Omnitrophica bacterium]|nr:hypothetical protein [Candidatus Omnitrophota bacterium]